MTGTPVRDESRTLLALWGAILVPPVAWSLHLVLGYLLVTLTCLANWSALVFAVTLHGLTLLLAVATVASAVIAWRTGRAAPPAAVAGSDAASGRSRAAATASAAFSESTSAAAAPALPDRAAALERRAFMVHAAILLSALFLLLILAGAVPTFFVPPCSAST